MRLLKLGSRDELSLTKDILDEVPPYAILSHTWGADEDEVTFDDIESGLGKRKAGYAKILFCGKQAWKDGLKHFWVDTCCINKANYTELSEAITSMFRWYRDAVKCYVYLSDVSTRNNLNDETERMWESAFRESRWFTRGWTLQELLAPKSVEFFAQDEQVLGDKKMLEQHIHEITGIPITALPGVTLSHFSIDERKRWAEKRETKRKEDKAYCLLGIFDVSMSLRYGEGEKELIRLQKKIDRLSTTSSQSFGVCLGQAPQIAPDAFIGRTNELQQLRDWLLPQSHANHQCIVSIVGMGGIGKTQLSLAHVRDYAEDYSSVFWVNSVDEASLKRSMADLGGVIYHNSSASMIQSADNEKLKIDQVRRWLSEPGNDQWLLIFDNYDDPNLPGVRSPTGYDIRLFFPTRSQGSIIITSRSTKLAFSKQLKLQKFKDVNTSMAILSQRSRREVSQDSDGSNLAQRLGGLPLALATAGTFLRSADISCGEYLRLYESAWMDLVGLDTEELFEYEARTMMSTWTISLNQVRSQNADAAELFAFLAYLSHRDIWYDLIKAGASDAIPWMGRVTGSKIYFQRVMSKLQDYSLVDVVAGSYQVHPCLHDWLVESLNTPPAPISFITALTCIADSIEDDSSPQFWVTNRRLLEHTEVLESPRFQELWQVCVSEEIVLDAAHSIARLLQDWNWLEEAEKMYQRALAGYETALGGEHTSTLRTVNNLGNLYSDQGKLAETEKMYQRALAGYETALGGEHTSTLRTVNNLGNLYRDQGNLAEAEKMYQRALTGYEAALGGEHTSTLSTVNNLGLLYSDQGKLAEAEKMYQRALAGYETALGGEHTSTLRTVNNLGNLYSNQGKLAEAEKMYQRALAGYEMALGGEHTSTLRTVNNLGNLYRDQGKLAEAEKMYQRALAGKEKALGGEHTSTLRTVNNLGNLYSDQGNLAEAEKMYQRALTGHEKVLGGEHTSTLRTVNNLGNLYSNQGKLAEAEKMYQRALAGYETALGGEHTSTLDTVNNLGNLYSDQGKLAEAEKMLLRALAGYEKALGGEHTSTLRTVNNLGNLYRNQGNLAEAEKMYQRIIGFKDMAELEQSSSRSKGLRDSAQNTTFRRPGQV